MMPRRAAEQVASQGGPRSAANICIHSSAPKPCFQSSAANICIESSVHPSSASKALHPKLCTQSPLPADGWPFQLVAVPFSWWLLPLSRAPPPPGRNATARRCVGTPRQRYSCFGVCGERCVCFGVCGERGVCSPRTGCPAVRSRLPPAALRSSRRRRASRATRTRATARNRRYPCGHDGFSADSQVPTRRIHVTRDS